MSKKKIEALFMLERHREAIEHLVDEYSVNQIKNITKNKPINKYDEMVNKLCENLCIDKKLFLKELYKFILCKENVMYYNMVNPLDSTQYMSDADYNSKRDTYVMIDTKTLSVIKSRVEKINSILGI